MSAGPPPLIFRWDLDKTYLLSEFDTLREMVKIPFERGEDKIAAPGVAALIRGLRTTALGQGRGARIYFLSASPPQIGRAIRRKLELDGILYDGIVFKDQLQRLFRGKFRHLREQVGYKLTELLKARRSEPPPSREYLFGDDWESDPLIYSLYADVVAGRVAPAALAELLQAARVDRSLIEEAGRLAAELQPADAVARIYINLERPTPPAMLRVYGPRLVPSFNYFQTAACLHAENALAPSAVCDVARTLLEESGFTPVRLANSLDDIVRRGHLPAAAAARLRVTLATAGLLPPPLRARRRLRDWWRGTPSAGSIAVPPPAAVDYRALVGAHEGAAE
jgi:hypothetical protein